MRKIRIADIRYNGDLQDLGDYLDYVSLDTIEGVFNIDGVIVIVTVDSDMALQVAGFNVTCSIVERLLDYYNSICKVDDLRFVSDDFSYRETDILIKEI